MLTFNEINVLGQILESSWGKASHGIKHHLQDNILVLRYSTIVHFSEERALTLQTRRLEEESVEICKKRIAEIKKEFKEKAGVPLKLKERLNNDSVQLIQASQVNPRRIALYNRFVELTVEN